MITLKEFETEICKVVIFLIRNDPCFSVERLNEQKYQDIIIEHIGMFMVHKLIFEPTEKVLVEDCLFKNKRGL